jgi:bloom syndrome protein
MVELGVPVLTFGQDMGHNERNEVMSRLENYKLVFITPEMYQKNQNLKNKLSELYSRTILTRLVIDEAHCLSQWGRDFRTDYLNMRTFRLQFPNVCITALTATATDRTKEDVINILLMKDTIVFMSNYNRPNLSYKVLPKKKKASTEDIFNLINSQYNHQSGIIY